MIPNRASSIDTLVTSYTDWTEWHHSEVHDASVVETEVSIDGELELLPVDPASPRSLRARLCLYCNAQMQIVDTFTNRTPSGFGGATARGGTETRASVHICESCGWWYILCEHDHVAPIIPPVGEFATIVYESILKRFRVDDQKVPLEALRAHLERSKSDVYNVDTRLFENLIANIYADYFPHCQVRHVGGPGDNGIDIYAVLKEKPCVIQVKRRSSPGQAEGPSVVRELVGVMFSEGVKHAHLVTTADRFTKAAFKAARRQHLKRSKCQIELIALPELRAMLEVANKRLRSAWQEAWNNCRKT
jgi:hypothetical protein